MEGGYEVWMGQPVILRVVAGNLKVPLRGRLLSETNDVVTRTPNWRGRRREMRRDCAPTPTTLSIL